MVIYPLIAKFISETYNLYFGDWDITLSNASDSRKVITSQVMCRAW